MFQLFEGTRNKLKLILNVIFAQIGLYNYIKGCNIENALV